MTESVGNRIFVGKTTANHFTLWTHPIFFIHFFILLIWRTHVMDTSLSNINIWVYFNRHVVYFFFSRIEEVMSKIVIFRMIIVIWQLMNCQWPCIDSVDVIVQGFRSYWSPQIVHNLMFHFSALLGAVVLKWPVLSLRGRPGSLIRV